MVINQRFSSSILKKIALFLGVLIILLMIGGNDFLKKEVENKIQKAGQQFSKLNYEELNVGLFSGKIQLKQVELNWKATAATENNLDKNLALTATSASVLGLSWWNLLVNNQIKIKEVRLENPDLSFFQLNATESIFKELFTKKENNNVVKENIAVGIDKIKILNGSMQGFNDSLRWVGFDSLDLELSGFNFDKEAKIPVFIYKDLDWQLHNFYFQEKDGLHALQLETVKGSNKNNTLIINKLHLKPLISKRQFSDYLEYKTARLDLKIPSLTVSDFQWDSLLLFKTLRMEKLVISDPALFIFDDKNVPRCPNCYKAFPQEVLLKSKLPILVDSVIINNGFIEYEHLVPEHTRIGKIAFENLQATLVNVTNISEKITESPTATLYAQTDVEGDGRLYLTADFHLTDPQYRFTYEGNLQNMDLVKINSMIEFSARVSIKKGQIQHLIFKGEGDNIDGSGTMDFAYENLDIALLTEDYQIGKKLLSQLINDLLIRNNNPNKKDYRNGKMYAERLKNRSIFNLWWQSILSGMKSTMLPKLILPDELKIEEEEEKEKKKDGFFKKIFGK